MRAVLLSFAMLVAAVGPVRAEDDSCMPLANATPQMLSWLQGDWTTTSGKGQAQQSWSAPINGIMVGHEIVATTGATAFTFLRITKTAHGVSLFVSINGAEPFEFTATEICSARVVFEGDTTGYPSRIVYLNTLTSTAERQDTPAERKFHPIFVEPLM